MKDPIEHKGQKYISTKEASLLTGYTADYVGQLARLGKIRSRIIGKTRFINEFDLLEYGNSNDYTVNGDKFLSTKDASKITGYSQDYIGQLARSGKISSTIIGRVLFVLKDEVIDYANTNRTLSQNHTDEHKDQNDFSNKVVTSNEKQISHTAEKVSILPKLNKKKIEDVVEVDEQNIRTKQPSFLVRILKTPILFNLPNRIQIRRFATSVLVVVFIFSSYVYITNPNLAFTKYVEIKNLVEDTANTTFFAFNDVSENVLEKGLFNTISSSLVFTKNEINKTRKILAQNIGGTSKLIGFTLREVPNTISAIAEDISPKPVSKSVIATAIYEADGFIGKTAIQVYCGISSLFTNRCDNSQNSNIVINRNLDEARGRLLAQRSKEKSEIEPVNRVQIPTKTIIVQGDTKIIERVVERTDTRAVSKSELELRLQQLSNKLFSELYLQTANNGSRITNVYQAVSNTNKIDLLHSVDIQNSTIVGGTIDNTPIGASTPSTGVFTNLSATSITTSSGSFTGALSTGGQLTVSGTGTSTIAGDVNFDLGTLYIDSVNDRVGIGTSSPTDTLSISGPIYLAPISPSETSGRLYNTASSLYWNGSLIAGATVGNWTSSGSNIYRATGNVGIGTTSPYARLSVVGETVSAYYTATSTTQDSSFQGFTATNATTTNIFSGTASTTNLVTSKFTLSNITGFLKATAGNVATALVDLASDVTGVLGISNGGTGTSTPSQFLFGTGSNIISTSTIASNYLEPQVLLSGEIDTEAELEALLSDVTDVFTNNDTIGDANIADNITLTNITQITNRAISDTTGTLAVNRGGTASTSPSGFFYGPNDGTLVSTTTITQNFIDPLIARDSELHSAITLTGENYLSLSAQQITANAVNLAGTNVTGTLDVPNGGTGATTLTGLLQGNGTSAFTAIADSSTVGQILRVTGASTYGWGALNLADTDAITGTLPVASGGTGVTTFGGTNTVLYTTSADTLASNSNFVFDGTNFGVGTSSPYAKLSVTGYINTDQYSGYKQAGNTILYASSTNFSTLVGQGAGAALLSDGLYNTALGYNALNVATSSDDNTAVGYIALESNTTGKLNTAVGRWSLYSNTTGNYNTALGSDSLSDNTTGINNVGIGSNSLQYNSTGSDNTAIGYYTLFNNNSSNSNIAIGSLAGFGKILGAYSNQNNTLVGYKAGYSVETGSDNNLFLGYQAGLANTTGANNILIGYQPGDNLTTGSNNIVLGYDIDTPSVTSANTLNIGNLIFGTGIDGVGTTLSSGNIGIGTTSPGTLLSLGDTGANTINISATATSTFGSGIDLSTGCFSVNGTCVGGGGGGSSTFLGLTDTPSSFTAGSLLFTSGSAVTEDNASLFFDDTNNRLGIGTTSPWAKLSVHGLGTDADPTAPLFVVATSTPTATTTAFIIDSAGQIGIGTENPRSALDVVGTTGFTWAANGISSALVTIGNQISTGGGSLFVNTPTLNNSDWASGLAIDGSYSNNHSTVNIKAVGVKNSNYSSELTFSTSNGATLTEAMVIDENSNVGIGTTSPYAKLSVVGETVSEYFTATSTTATSTFAGDITAASERFSVNSVGDTILIGRSAGKASIKAKGDTSNNNYLMIDSSGQYLSLNHYSSDNVFLAKGGGKVGIGDVTTPLADLHVFGADAQDKRAVIIDADGDTSGDIPFAIRVGTNVSNLTDADTKFLVNFQGNIGIGTTSPYAKLSVVGETVAEYFTATSTTATSTFAGGLSVAGTSGLTVLQNGNVGIGRVDPRARLDLGNYITSGSVPSEITSDYQLVLGVKNNSTGAYSNNIAFVEPTSDTPAAAISAVDEGGNSATGLAFSTAYNTSLTEYLRIGYTGKIGIGTTSPGTLLSLGDTGANTINISATATSTFGSGIDLSTGCFSVNGTCVGGGGGGSSTFLGLTDTPSSFTAGSLLFTSGSAVTEDNASLFFDDTNNRLGIGTTSPFANLSIDLSAGEIPFAIGSSTLTTLLINDKGLLTTPQYTNVTHLGGYQVNYGNSHNDSVIIGDSSSTQSSGTLTNTVLIGSGQTVAGGVNYSAIIGQGISVTNGASDNVVIGAAASVSAGAADSNVVIGRSAGSGFGESIVLGMNSSATANNQLMLGANNATGEILEAYIGQNSTGIPLIYANQTGVGIGTTSPYAKLSVVGETVAEKFTATSTTATSTFAGGLAIETSGLVYDYSTNNVGIGTAGPTDKLNVNGNLGILAGGGLRLYNTANSQFATVVYDNTNNEVDLNYPLHITAGSSAPILSVDQTSTGDILNLFDNGIEIFTVLDGGNIGIGTTTPYAKLSVVGETVAEKFTATSTTATSTFAGGFDVGNGALQYDFSANVTSIEKLNLGNVEFEENAGAVSWVDLSVTSSAPQGTVERYTAQIDSTPILTVYAESDGSGGVQNQRVGIGTTSPYAKLSVVGETVAEYFTATSTTATSTFAGGLNVLAINQTGTATSTFTSGIDLSTGCFSVNGTCVGGGGGGSSTFLGLTDTPSSFTAGSLLFTSGSAVTEDNASLFFDDTNNRLGIGTTSPFANLSIDLSAGEIPFAIGSSTLTTLLINDKGLLTTPQYTNVTHLGGYTVGYTSTHSDSVIIGDSSSVQNGGNITDAVLIGAKQTVTGGAGQTVAIGQSANINNGAGINVLIGNNVTASASASDSGVAIGANADLAHAQSIVIGRNAVSTAANQLMLGANNATGEILEAYIGQNSTGIPLIYANQTGVGIGTTSPWAKLSVHGLSTDADPTAPLFVVATSTPTATTTAFLVTNSGSVGIGTESPAEILHIASSVDADVIFQTSAASQQSGLKFYRSRGTVESPTIVADNDTLMTITGYGYDGASYQSLARMTIQVDGTPSAGDVPTRIDFDTTPQGGSRTTRLSILPSGNIGIGTTSPYTKLSVTGYINTDQYSGYKQAGNTILYASSTNFSTLVGQGAGAGLLSDGIENTAVGYQALNIATSGDYNTAVGYQALSNTTGGVNTAVGRQALQNNTTGNNNVALGVNSLLSNTTGGKNVANGSSALTYNTTGTNNVAIGYSTLENNISATSTIAIGSFAGFGKLKATGGYYAQNNTLIGYKAGQALQTGSDNNLFLGYQAGLANTTGANNILIGYQPGDNLTTGSNNIVLGYDIDTPSVTSANTLNIGNLIFGTGIDGVGTTLSSGNIGIGTTSPGTLLSLGNTGANTINISATATSTFGSGIDLSTGCFSVNGTCVGGGGGGSSTFLGLTDTPSSFTAGSLLFTSGSAVTEDNASLFFDDTNNRLGIGTTSPWAQLSVNPNGISGPSFAIGSSTQTDFVVTNGGKVGIGVSNPTAALNIDTSTSSTTPLIIKTSGNVGNYTASTTGIFIHDVNGTEILRIVASDPNSSNYNSVNTYIGRQAGYSQPSDNTSAGYYNTGVGNKSLWTNSTGYENAAFGAYPLFSNTTGYGNTGIGAYSLFLNTDGDKNSALGGYSLYNNTIGIENTAVGRASLYSNTTGLKNTAQGRSSLYSNTTGSVNTGVGGYSLFYNTTGATSTAIGYASGYNPDNDITQYRIIDDTFMTLIGSGATKNNASTLTNGIAIGYNAYVLASNQAVLGNDNITTTLLKGNVGIGTTSPYAKLSVVGETVSEYFTATSTTATSTFSGGLSVDSGAILYDYSANETSISKLNLGNITFDQDAGAVSWIDLAVTSSASAGTVESYTAQIDSNTIFSVYAQSDGTGGITDVRAVVGTTTNAILGSSNIPYGSLIVSDGALCVDDSAGNDCSTSARSRGGIYAQTASVGALDLAEKYPTKDTTLSAGEIIMLDVNNPVFVSRYDNTGTGSSSPTLFGVVSTDPGLLLGGFGIAPFENETKIPVTLAGRVPVKVNDEGGAISVGDKISPSTVPGIGKKAIEGEESVGIALQPYSSQGEGNILVFVKTERFSGISNTNLSSLSSSTGTSTPTTSTGIFSDFLAFLENLGVRITNGFAYFTNLVTDTLKVGSPQKPSGITLYDEVTGEPYCLVIRNGEMVSNAGECGVAPTGQTQTNADGTRTGADTNTLSPTVSINGNNPAQILVGTTYSDLGAIATDQDTGNEIGYIISVRDNAQINADGSPVGDTQINADASRITINESGQVYIDTSVDGTYTITYEATSQAGVTTSTDRTVIVGTGSSPDGEAQTNADGTQTNADTNVDTATSTPPIIPVNTPPELTLIGNASITLIVGDTFTDEGAIATDAEDGDISSSITTGGDTVDTNTEGTYTITYNVTDSAGDQAPEVTRTVNINPAPVSSPDGEAQTNADGTQTNADTNTSTSTPPVTPPATQQTSTSTPQG